MARAVFILTFAMFLGQATGLASLVQGACGEECSDDGMGGQCASDCSSCACCSHAQAVAVPMGSAIDLPLLECSVIWRASEVPSSPAPADIFHIPKAILA